MVVHKLVSQFDWRLSECLSIFERIFTDVVPNEREMKLQENVQIKKAFVLPDNRPEDIDKWASDITDTGDNAGN
jgi:hypothetical protein